MSHNPRSLAIGFLSSIREALPETAVVREAVNFIDLVIEHPNPPRRFAALHKILWEAVHVDTADPIVAAKHLRRAGHQALRLSQHSTSGQILELALLVLSLRFDDRPSQRMLVVDIAVLAGGVDVIGIQDAVPEWKYDGTPSNVISGGVLHPWVRAHVGAVCRQSEAESRKPADTFSGWTSQDFACALLALRMAYCIFKMGLDGETRPAGALLEDFDTNGTQLWNLLERAIRFRPGLPQVTRSLDRSAWHLQARHECRGAIGGTVVFGRSAATPLAAPSPTTPIIGMRPAPPPVLQAAQPLALAWPTDRPMLTVCRSPILDSSERYDKDEIARHKILEQPLPLARMPEPDEIREIQAKLGAEFPWAGSVLEAICGDLLGRSCLGVRALAMPPTLLVGRAGSGKSRLARRIAEELKVPKLDLSLGGISDTKVLGGTSRGWASGRPGDLATLMATRRTASAIVLLDEIDKAIDGLREGGGIQAYLLGLLEKETASRQVDVFLKTEVDYSAVMWIATANALSPLQKPLVSRFRVLMLEQPRREHFPVIAETVLCEVATGWGIERDVLPTLRELDLPWKQLASARQVRLAVERAVVDWARKVRWH